MGYFDEDHLIDEPITAGASTGFFENMSQAYEQQRRVDSPQSIEVEVAEQWEENLRALSLATGRQYDAPSTYAWIREQMNPGSQGDYGVQVTQASRDIQEGNRINEEIKNLRNPEIKTIEQIFADVYKMQQEVDGKTNDISSRATGLGVLGSIVGGIGGSLSAERDPVGFFSLGLGGAGRTVAMRIGTEMLAAGAVTAFQESQFVNPARERAGLEARSVLYDTLLATAGAGIIQGGFEGIGKLLARIPSSEPAKIDLDFEDAQLRQMFEAAPQSPRARAGLDIIDDVRAAEMVMPYGTGRQGQLRFEGELEEVARVFGGQTDTAIARVLPEVPFEFIQKEADLWLVKERAPELYAKLETAKARVVELEQAGQEITARLESTTLPDAVRLVDQEAAARLDELSAIVNDAKTPEPARAAAELEAEAIVNRVGPEKIAKALNDAEIAPRQQVKRLKSERKAAIKRYREVHAEIEAQRSKMQAEQDVVNALQSGRLAAQLSFGAGRQPFMAPLLRHEVADATATAVSEAADLVDDTTKRLLDPPEVLDAEGKPTSGSLVDEAGMVDIGLKDAKGKPLRVPGDFTFRAFDPDGTERDLTFADALREMQDDVDLDNAVRTCTL